MENFNQTPEIPTQEAPKKSFLARIPTWLLASILVIFTIGLGFLVYATFFSSLFEIKKLDCCDLPQVAEEQNKDLDRCEVDSDCEFMGYAYECHTPEYIEEMERKNREMGLETSRLPWKEGECACVDNKCISKEIVEWQTYRNEEFGFELKYPEDWKFESDIIGNVVTISQVGNEISPKMEIQFPDEEYTDFLNKEEQIFDEWQQTSIEQPSGEINNVVFAGISAKEFVYYSPVGFIEQVIILSKNNQTIAIRSYKCS